MRTIDGWRQRPPLTVARIISVAVDQRHLDATIQDVAEMVEVATASVIARRLERIQDGVGADGEVDGYAEGLLHPTLVQEADEVVSRERIRIEVRDIVCVALCTGISRPSRSGPRRRRGDRSDLLRLSSRHLRPSRYKGWSRPHRLG